MIRAGQSVLASIYSYVFSCFKECLDLMQDSAITRALSFNFLYVLICFWIVWQAVNMFIINPLPGGDLAPTALKAHREVRQHVRLTRDRVRSAASERRYSRDAFRPDPSSSSPMNGTIYSIGDGSSGGDNE